MNKWFFAVLLSVLTLTAPSISSATPDFARQTGFRCKECHVDPAGGGPRTDTGEKFLKDLKAISSYSSPSTAKRIIHFIIGYIHLITAVVWFGTIFYVHILLKPAYAAKGLPKGELFLGWTSILILAVTGTLLSISRISTWQTLFTTRFGILLCIKIFLFLIMVSTAVAVTFYIGPRIKRKLKERYKSDILKGKQDLNADELHGFDGKEGRPAFVVYKGNIYDVTNSRLWKEGQHARKHRAGFDMTEVLKTAPHGEEKIFSMPVVGKLIKPGKKPPKPLPERIFYFFAYANLVFVFLITFIVALWRWW